MSEYSMARLAEIAETGDGRCPYRPVRHHFGISSFGVNAWTAREAGDRIINEHDEEDEHEELYVVTEGRARFELAGESFDAPAGTYVYAKPGVKRTAFAEEPGTTLLAIGGQPGKAYEVSGWEIWAPFNAQFEAGEYDAVIEHGRETLESAGYPAPLYNLACSEARAGRPDDAIEHLRQAIELSERFRKYAKSDPDFESLRDEPRFRELVGG